MFLVALVTPALQVQLSMSVCRPDSDGIGPISSVWVTIGTTKTRLADLRSNVGSAANPKEFGTLKYPKGALTGIRGWWAGAGQDFSVVKGSTGYKVMTRWVQEESPSLGPWTTYLELDKSGKANPKYTLAGIAGKYKGKPGKGFVISSKAAFESEIGKGEVLIADLTKGAFFVTKDKTSTELCRLQFSGKGKSLSVKMTWGDYKSAVFTLAK